MTVVKWTGCCNAVL